MSSLKKYGIFLASGLGIYSLLVLAILINGLIANPVITSSEAAGRSTKYKNLYSPRSIQRPVPTSVYNQNQAAPSQPVCLEGMKELQLGDCGNGSAPVYGGVGGSGSAGSTTNTSVSKDPITVTMSIVGVICQDESVVPFAPFEGCETHTKEEWSSILPPLQAQMQTLCAGKKSAACSAGGGAPSVTSVPLPTNTTQTNKNAGGGVPGTTSTGTGSPTTAGGASLNTTATTTTGVGAGKVATQLFNVGSESCDTKSKGDANCDGLIDLLDFRIWAAEYSSGSGLSADFNGDGAVTFADFSIWRDNYVL